MTPTQRTLAKLKADGYKAGIVERFIPRRNIRIDLFNIIDIIAIEPGEILGVQSTGSAFSEHWHKLTEDKAQESYDWIKAGGILELWGWRKLKVKRGGKAMRWEPRIKQITIHDLKLDQ